MSFRTTLFREMKHANQNANMGKVRKIRFKDKDKYFKHGEHKKEIPLIVQTEEEKVLSREKVRQEMKKERKQNFLLFLWALLLFALRIGFFVGVFYLLWWLDNVYTTF